MDLLSRLGQLFAVPTTHVRKHRCVDCGTTSTPDEGCPDCGGELEEAVETVPCSYWGEYH
jgi:rRNA maturation endonuclease Nob1